MKPERHPLHPDLRALGRQEAPEENAGAYKDGAGGGEGAEAPRGDHTQQRSAGADGHGPEVEAHPGVVPGGREAALPLQALHVLGHHQDRVGQTLPHKSRLENLSSSLTLKISL